jgi:curved DNA-binding protein CbpA
LSDAHMRKPEAVAPIDASRLTPAEQVALTEDVDLDAATRRQILETHRSLDSVDHYELLGLDSAADKRTLRRAYFELAARFHPDRFFRKRLGSFKHRMEGIFGRLTLAHETLANAERRAEYDAYLEEQRRSRGIERLLAEAITEAQRASESIEREVRAQTGAPSFTAWRFATPEPATVRASRAAPGTRSDAPAHASPRAGVAHRRMGAPRRACPAASGRTKPHVERASPARLGRPPAGP